MSETNETSETVEVATCACGCGVPTGKRSDWRQGHDQRAKGWLQRAKAGRLFEGERELVTALLERKEARRALSTPTFRPLVAAAKARFAKEAAAAAAEAPATEPSAA